MPVFVAALLGGLVNIAGTLAGQVLIGLGISVVTYSGLNITLEWLKTGAVGAFLGLPPQVVGLLALMKVGSCISMVFSAISVKLVLDGVKNGVLTKWTKS